MKKIADRIIKGKYVVFAVCAALLVVSCIFLPKIGVNYNLSDYLSKDTETRIALDIMEDEFGLTGNVQVMLSGVNESAAKEIKSVLSEIENVSQVEFDAESTNYFKDGKALYIVLIQGDDYSETAAEVISDIKEAVASYDAEFGGTAAQKQSQKEAITRQIPMILAICICIAYGILVVTTRSWLEPLLFLATAGIAVLINLGTNIIFGSISYITNSIAAILQLALRWITASCFCIPIIRTEKRSPTRSGR
ncbi:MAG: MMPL family transporter [Candidatus Borkfalkia sp.]